MIHQIWKNNYKYRNKLSLLREKFRIRIHKIKFSYMSVKIINKIFSNSLSKKCFCERFRAAFVPESLIKHILKSFKLFVQTFYSSKTPPVILNYYPVKVTDEHLFDRRLIKNISCLFFNDLRRSINISGKGNFHALVSAILRVRMNNIIPAAIVHGDLPWRRRNVSHICRGFPADKNIITKMFSGFTDKLCGLSPKPGTFTNILRTYSVFSKNTPDVFGYTPLNIRSFTVSVRNTPAYLRANPENINVLSATFRKFTALSRRFTDKINYPSQHFRRTPANAGVLPGVCGGS